mmetsp:Transcript_13022/g.19256  ORF Transcript_13022/g.19256 Transcript_13022/m.19256 type:complete len:100 (-) Transcript_13022:38-337(-)
MGMLKKGLHDIPSSEHGIEFPSIGQFLSSRGPKFHSNIFPPMLFLFLRQLAHYTTAVEACFYIKKGLHTSSKLKSTLIVTDIFSKGMDTCRTFYVGTNR